MPSISLRHRRLAVDLAQPLGDSAWIYPAPEEPRPAYDPAHTTLTERRRAKAAELRQLDRQEAEHLGLEWLSERALEQMAALYAEHGPMGLADGRWTPPLRGRWAVTEEVAEATGPFTRVPAPLKGEHEDQGTDDSPVRG